MHRTIGYLLLLLPVGIVFTTSAGAQHQDISRIERYQTSPEREVSTSKIHPAAQRSPTTSLEHPVMHARVFRSASSESESYDRWARRMAIIQGSYYVATGLWPILHMQSFEAVTGPKTDEWLVKTVGALISVVGGTLVITGIRDRPSRDLAALAVGSAAVLTAVDVIYVAQNRIPPVYLLDAAGETVLMAGWTITLSQ